MASKLGCGPTRDFCLSESARQSKLAADCNEKRWDAYRKGDIGMANYYSEHMRTHEKWARHYREKAEWATD